MRHNPGYGIMGQLVKRRPVVVRRGPEGVLRRQMDGILRSAVEGAVRLVMSDPGTGIGEDLLAGLGHVPLVALAGLVGWNSVHLLCVENGIDAVNGGVSRMGSTGVVWRVGLA